MRHTWYIQFYPEKISNILINLQKRLGYCIRMCAANILLPLCQIIWFLLFSDEKFIENDSLLSILWDGSLDRGLASTLIMSHGVCKRFWLNILQSKWGTHCSSDKIISHTLSKWKPFIALGSKFSCKRGEHYKKNCRC